MMPTNYSMMLWNGGTHLSSPSAVLCTKSTRNAWAGQAEESETSLRVHVVC